MHSSTINRGVDMFSPENINWNFQEVREVTWTPEENKLFERSLAFLDDKEDLESWFMIAALIPGKTVGDVIKRYKELENDVIDIEAGRIPIPGYGDEASHGDYFFNLQNFDDSHVVRGKRSWRAMAECFRPPMPEKERKKGLPWTEDEHRRFLMGLEKYGKGDWRHIAKNFVKTRTATQVASHAQKYFIRQLTDCKDKRRSSIHDITTANISDINADTSATAKTAAATHSPTQTNPRHSFEFAWAPNYCNAFPQWT